MNRILAAGVFALAFLASSAYATETCSKTDAHKMGEVPSCLVFDGATANTESAVIDTYGYRNLGLQIWAATTSEATINILCRGYSSSASGAEVAGPWTDCSPGGVEPTNPDSTGLQENYISLPRAYQYKITITGYVSGTIYASFERYSW